MKIVVVGGTGLVGRGLVDGLRERGHEAVAAAPSTGVDTLTGAGLAEVLAGAEAVVDVTNSPSFAPDDVLRFFTTSTTNQVAAERAAGVAHHVIVSIVGADGLPDSGYLRAKVAQEELVKESGVPYTILRATQFFEFLGPIADTATDGDTVTLPETLLQPVAAADLSAALVEIATAAPVNGTIEIAGPDRRPMAELVGAALAARDDSRTVVTSTDAQYFGTLVAEASLVPAGAPDITTPTGFEAWLKG
jgi:uncharacterized protein YbjT (DUF2867 family)